MKRSTQNTICTTILTREQLWEERTRSVFDHIENPIPKQVPVLPTLLRLLSTERRCGYLTVTYCTSTTGGGVSVVTRACVCLERPDHHLFRERKCCMCCYYIRLPMGAGRIRSTPLNTHLNFKNPEQKLFTYLCLAITVLVCCFYE